MRTVGSLLPECLGGVTVGGVCPECGRLSKSRSDGQTRAHEDARAWLEPLVDDRLSITDRAKDLGVYYQLVEWNLRRYPWIVAARRANRAGAALRRAMERALRLDLRCRTCGTWVLRKDGSQYPACSPECGAATLVCFDCRQLKPTARFRGSKIAYNASTSLCDVCNRRRAGAWRKAHMGQFSPISQKRCPACWQTKPSEEFNRSTSSRSGLQTYCKACATQLEKGTSVAELARKHGHPYKRTRQRFADSEAAS